MDDKTGAPRPPSLQTDRAYASNNVSNTTLTGSPLSSAPATPSLHTPTAPTRRPSQPATSPITAHSPNPAKNVRRASSAMSYTQRPSSSPGLKKKTSRTSLGAQATEENGLGENRPTPKRSISNLITGLREAQGKMEMIEEPIPLTAAQIAVEHFARELLAHGSEECTAETVVILHDACYGHRYSRLKTTKSTLSMIVERPERIHASVLGAATAYVRLGGDHAGGANAPRPGGGNVAQQRPFKIRRTGRMMSVLSQCVTSVHGSAWMGELKGMCEVAGIKLAAGEKELSRDPTNTEKRKLHEGDLYLSSESLNAFQGALGGVADAIDTVFAAATPTKRAFVAVRPPGHHCSADYPSGFCWLNNVHVGIEYAAQTHGLTHAAILDFDLHHGDGSQAITWSRNSENNEKRLNAKPNSKLKLGPAIGYYSLHDINSYPCEMGDDEKVQAASLCIDNAHGQSVWNVHLEEWKTEEDFWELYETKYRVLLDKARGFLRQHAKRVKDEGKVAPKAAVFISAGFDASEWEGAGMQRHKVNVPTEFYARFTRDVVELAREEGTTCDGRVISVLEGGYSDRALCSGVLSHLSGLCARPAEVVKKEEPADAIPLDQMMRGLGINGTSSTSHTLFYDRSWWSAGNLTALELKVNPPPPAMAKKMRVGQQPTYATPTESFAYKVVDTDKFARSISGTMRDVARPARPPTPPVPEVDWVVATQELSKLLIPSDRQTRSCTPEELAGPKTMKAGRASILPTTATTEASAQPRQLRDRKAKGPSAPYAASAHSDELESVRSVSRSSRRQTVADFPLSNSDPVDGDAPHHQRRASRRLSAGSALSSLGGGEMDPSPPPVPSAPLPGYGAASANGASAGMRPPPPPASTAGVQVKKTRVPPATAAGAGTGAAATRKVKKTPAASSAPVSPVRGTKSISTAPMNTTVQPLAPALPAAPASANGTADVDALTSGLKKITLKVGSKEEHDRKQKEKVDAERRARALKAAETRRVNAAAKKAAAAAKVVPTHDVKSAAEPATASGASSQPLYPVDTVAAAEPAMVVDVPVEPQTQGLWFAEPNASSGEAFERPASTNPPGAQDDVQVHAVSAPPISETQAQLPPVQQTSDTEPPLPLLRQQQAPLPHDPILNQPPAKYRYVYHHPTPGVATPDRGAPTVPDSAARQLIHENTLANGVSGQGPGSGIHGSVLGSGLPPMLPTGGGLAGQGLPVWSSTGRIPFGTTAASEMNVSGDGGGPQGDSIPVARYGGDGEANGKMVMPNSALGEKDGRSIWDVPETPQR